MLQLDSAGYVRGVRGDVPLQHSTTYIGIEELIVEDVWLKSVEDRWEEVEDDDEGVRYSNIFLNDLLAGDSQFIFLAPTGRKTSYSRQAQGSMVWSFDHLRDKGYPLYFRVSDLAADYNELVRSLGYEEVGGHGPDAALVHPDYSELVAVGRGDGVVDEWLEQMALIGTVTEFRDVQVLARATANDFYDVYSMKTTEEEWLSAHKALQTFQKSLSRFSRAFLQEFSADAFVRGVVHPWASDGVEAGVRRMGKNIASLLATGRPDTAYVYAHQEVITSKALRVRDAKWASVRGRKTAMGWRTEWRPMEELLDQFGVVRKNPSRGKRRKVLRVGPRGAIGPIEYDR